MSSEPTALRPSARLELPKRILISGAAGGIGGAIASQLRGAGSEVIGTGRASKSPADWAGPWIGAELGTREGRALIRDSINGKIDGLVFAAGILDGAGWEEVREEQAAELLAVNLMAPFFLTRELLPKLETGASIVIVGSIAGMRGSPATPLYAASKAGLRNLAASLALLLQPLGMRVNVLAPGLIDTQLTTQLNTELAKARQVDEDTIARERAAAIPMARAGTCEEVADACLFLLSPQSSYFTGATLFPTGGVLAGMI